MEQRQFERKSVSLQVVISSSRLGLFRARVTDLGHGGAFIGESFISLPLHSPVTLTFLRAQDDIHAGCVSASGSILHVSERGFGVSFAQIEGGCAQALDCLISDPKVCPQLVSAMALAS